MEGLVLRAQSGFFWVKTTDDQVLRCTLRGKLKKVRHGSDIVVIGDRVTVIPNGIGEGSIEAVNERSSRFSRKQPGSRGAWREDVLIANLDQVFVVFACSTPVMNPRLLDRFLVVAEYNNVDAVIVANKIDMVTLDEAHAQFQLYEHIGYPVHYVSAHTHAGIASLRDQLQQRMSLFTGPSGAGKSSLLNALQPGLQLLTGEVSDVVGKGRHTTIVAELHLLENSAGGYVADTPGIRELAAWRIPDEELAWCFRDMRPYIGACSFSNCTHVHEPGCAVRDAVADGTLHAQRYDSYIRQRTNAER